MTRDDPDATVPVSELMGDDYDATVAHIRSESAAGRNPFAHIPAPRRSDRRPVPSLVIGAAMLGTWFTASLAQEWAAFSDVSGLFLMVMFVLFVTWAKSE